MLTNLRAENRCFFHQDFLCVSSHLEYKHRLPYEGVSKNKIRHGLHGLTQIYISFYTRTVIIYPCNPRNPCLKNKWLHFDFTFAPSDLIIKYFSLIWPEKMRLFLPLLYEGSQPPHEAIHCFDQASSLRCVTGFVGL